MALEDDLDPRILREFVSQVQDGGKITGELNDEIERSSNSFAKFRKAGIDGAIKSLKAVGGASKDLAAGMIAGNRSFDSLNPAIDLAAQAVTALSSAIPLVGKAIGETAQVVAEGSKLMLNQIQMQVDAFQQVGEVGALGADGLSGLQKQFIDSGLTLQSYTKSLQNSSTTLARFSGLTSGGAEKFSQIVGQLTNVGGIGLRRMGLSAEQLGESTEAFLTRQTRLGLSQGVTTQLLATQTTEYVKELDLLSKATGLSRKAIQSQQDAALSETRFRASMEGLRGTAEEGSIQKIMNFQTTISDMDEGLGAGVRDLASGFTATEAARRAEFVTGGRASKIMDKLRKGQISELDARVEMQQAVKDNRELLISSGKALGDTTGIVGQTAGLFDFMNAILGENGKFVKQASDTQRKQIEGNDKMTGSAVAAQQGIETMQRNLSQVFFEAMPKATEVIDSFVGTMNKGIVSITEMFDPELAADMRERIIKMGGEDIETSKSKKEIADLDLRLRHSKKGIGKVNDDEITAALKGKGIDTATDRHMLDFARQHGVRDAIKASRAEKGATVADTYGKIRGIKFKGSRNITVEEMMSQFKADRGYACLLYTSDAADE